MRKIKKIISIFLALAMTMSMTSFASFEDVPADAPYADAVEHLVSYGVLNGKGNGSFDPDGWLTRAEMSKISSILTGLDDMAPAYSGVSTFADMEGDHWASGYINVAAKNGLILGYPNGTFEPERSLTVAEAVTVVLRALGYTTDDLGNNWPASYMAKAAELKITEGISHGTNEAITRGEISMIIDKALLLDINKSSKKLIEQMDFTVSDECLITETYAENKSLLPDQVNTTLGVYKKLNDLADSYVGRKVKLVISKDKEIASVLPIDQQVRSLTVDSVIEKTVSYTENGAKGEIELDNTTLIYYKGVKKTASEILPTLEKGSTIQLYSTPEGKLEYVFLTTVEMEGPVVAYSAYQEGATSIGSISFDPATVRVVRDGKTAALTDIARYDVVYFNPSLNQLNVYVDKKSGLYEKAVPNKADITGVQVGGTVYEIGSQQAVTALGDTTGAFDIHDYVTLLLGRDGKVVAAVDANSEDVSKYAILLGSSERVSDDEDTKGSHEYVAKVFTVSGETVEYKTDRDYEKYRGSILELNFEGDMLKPKFITGSKISGKINVDNRTIGEKWLTKDAKIVEITYSPEIDEPGEAQARLIELADIGTDTLSENDVLHAHISGKFGDIQFLVLNNVSNDAYRFGIVTEREASSFGTSISSSYTIDFGGSQQTFRGSTIYSGIGEGTPVMVNIQENTIVSMKALEQVGRSGLFSGIDTQRIQLNSQNYKLAPGALCFNTKNYKINAVSINEMEDLSPKNVRLYSDKTLTKGGEVRIILFEN